MEVLRSVESMRQRADSLRAAGRSLALVPTMGALHQGHLALVDAARARSGPAGCVALSSFVNPAQFNSPADLAAYPRDEAADLAACRARGVDIAWLPPAAELYPPGAQTWVEVQNLQTPLCGRSRPGHFRGVATVVAKLLIIARPRLACFGSKDYQQLALVRRMARDLCLDVEIAAVPTQRAADGLALSSRNALLSPCARRQARALSRALSAAESACRAGEHSSQALLQIARRHIAAAPLARLDYAELRCPETLAPAPPQLRAPALLALAAFFPAAPAPPTAQPPKTADTPPPKTPTPETPTAPPAQVRLIDNRIIAPASALPRGAQED